MSFSASIPYFDAHCDTLSRCVRTGESLLDAAGQFSLQRLGAYNPSGQIFAVFADAAKFTPPELSAQVRRQIELYQREKSRYPDRMKHGALSIEGGELLDCDPEKLEQARLWGVRAVNITWNHANALSGSHAEDPGRGLSDRGREFVRRAAERNIFPDVSHLSDRGFFDLADMGLCPLFASHSNSRAVCPHTRNLTDTQFRLICESGGIVGVNLYTAFIGGNGSMETVLRHFDRFLSLGGERHIALGSDWDGGIIGAGNISGVQDMRTLADAMLLHGYGEALVRDIFYGNLARFLGLSPQSDG